MKFFLVFAAASSFILYIYFCLPSTPVRHPLKKRRRKLERCGDIASIDPPLQQSLSHSLVGCGRLAKKQTRESRPFFLAGPAGHSVVIRGCAGPCSSGGSGRPRPHYTTARLVCFTTCHPSRVSKKTIPHFSRFSPVGGRISRLYVILLWVEKKEERIRLTNPLRR